MDVGFGEVVCADKELRLPCPPGPYPGVGDLPGHKELSLFRDDVWPRCLL